MGGAGGGWEGDWREVGCGSEWSFSFGGSELGRSDGRGSNLHRRGGGRQFGVSGLPAGILPRVPGIDPRGNAARNRNRNRNAGHHAEEERDHTAGHRTGRASASNLVVLSKRR